MPFLKKFRAIGVAITVLLFFVANRYLYTEKYFPYLSFGALTLILCALLYSGFMYLRERKSDRKGEVTAWLFTGIWQSLIFGSLGIYLVYAHNVGEGPIAENGVAKLLLGAWVSLFVLGCGLAIGIEMARGFSTTSVVLEPKRIVRTAQSWFLVALLVIILVNANFIAAKLDKVWDWSYLKSTSPSDSTSAMIESSSESFEAAIFIAQDNDVLPFVRSYFDLLQQKTSKIKVNYFDRDLNPAQAEEFKASKNGQIVFKFQDKQHRVQLGENIASARKKLASLDSEVQGAYTKLVFERQTLYFTRGHGELQVGASDSDPLRSMKFYEELLKSQNYKLKPWGISEGSESDVPDDAACVLIVGPTSDFSAGELTSLRAYTAKGGKVLVFQDRGGSLKDDPAVAKLSAAGTPNLNAFLADVGIKFEPGTLANQKNFVRATKSAVDHWILFSNSFSTHESVSSLSRNDERLAVLFMRASHYSLEEKKSQEGGLPWKTFTLVRSMDGTFEDLNLNQKQDGSEGKSSQTYNLAVVSEAKTDTKDAKGELLTAKVLAVGDVQVVSDALVGQNRGNAIFALDSMRWLVGQSAFKGEAESEEDVKIRHTNKENVVWFSATVVACPLLVLGLGFVATRRKKRRSR